MELSIPCPAGWAGLMGVSMLMDKIWTIFILAMAGKLWLVSASIARASTCDAAIAEVSDLVCLLATCCMTYLMGRWSPWK
jgi:hypothetical protein